MTGVQTCALPICLDDFARFAGHTVDVRMRLPDASGRRHFVGLLRGVQDGVATLEVEGRKVALEIAGINRARLVPELAKGASALPIAKIGVKG